MAQAPTIDRLLNLVPDHPDTVLEQLQNHRDLASKQDSHGYSLLHAATSYGHLSMLQALVRDFNVDINIKDEDGETALFNAEDVDFAKEIVALGVDISARNAEGKTAAEKLDDEDEQPEVAAYLKALFKNGSSEAEDAVEGANESANHPPPPLPNGIQLNVGTMQENEVGEEPDPEFRSRIEELAARDDFEGAEGQRELHDLITDAVSGMTNNSQRTNSRRRLE